MRTSSPSLVPVVLAVLPTLFFGGIATGSPTEDAALACPGMRTMKPLFVEQVQQPTKGLSCSSTPYLFV